MIENKKQKFWAEENGKIKIQQSKLIKFLEQQGFAKVKLNEESYIKVRINDNRVRKTSIEEMADTVRYYLLEEKNNDAVYEVFSRGFGSYLNDSKLKLIKKVDLINDRDERDSARFFFKNVFCEITKDNVEVKPYTELEFPIWENRVLNYDFNIPKDKEKGQFEIFCKHLAKEDESRLEALRSFIGYLTHRNRDRGEDKAVILYDENMGLDDQAHGGTGKTLLGEAIKQCKEVVQFDGKDIKTGSWFKNQRIELTTDLLVYDDLNKTASLEMFFSTITTGVEVEKKHKSSFYLDKEKVPKVMITSNYIVSGPGGNSDERRRYEFEVANYFDADHTPEDEFGNRFFDKYWATEERNKFYLFMMQSVQLYFERGLIKADEINLRKSRLASATHPKFYEFANSFVETNTWQNKRDFEDLFRTEYSTDVTPHSMKKWLQTYSNDIGGQLKVKPKNSKYYFKINVDEDAAKK
ncbi:hypothetical protein [Mesonia sp.]|uniref:hypothetical protein n=1 Tax=Mesonia sp. TaxID=1960830 RepID=UPI003F98517B